MISGEAELDQVTSIEVPGLTNFEVIGKGGSSTVFKAVEAELDRLVAVKVLTGTSSQKVMRRFDAERKTMGRLSSHDGVVQVHYTGITTDGYPYIVMPLHTEGSLRDKLRNGPLPWHDAVGYVLSAAATIADAHRYGIWHLDLKPENLMLVGSGVKVADFGIARSIYAQANQQSLSTPDNNTADPTLTTYLTPAYAPPEALIHRQTSKQTDIYGLGATLWTLIAGRSPFEKTNGDNSPAAIATRAVADPIGDLRHLAPDAICRVIEQAMAKQPQGRHQNVEGFTVHLRTALGNQPPIDSSSRTAKTTPAPHQQPGSQQHTAAPYSKTTPYGSPQNLGTSTTKYDPADSQETARQEQSLAQAPSQLEPIITFRNLEHQAETEPSEGSPIWSEPKRNERRNLSATFAYILGIITTVAIGTLVVSVLINRSDKPIDDTDSDNIDAIGTEVEELKTTPTTPTRSTQTNTPADIIITGQDDASVPTADEQSTGSATSIPEETNTSLTTATDPADNPVTFEGQLPTSDEPRGTLLTSYNGLSQQPTFDVTATKRGTGTVLTEEETWRPLPESAVTEYVVWASGPDAQDIVDELEVTFTNQLVVLDLGDSSFSTSFYQSYINGNFPEGPTESDSRSYTSHPLSDLNERFREGKPDLVAPLTICKELFDETRTDEGVRTTNNLIVLCAEIYEPPLDAPQFALDQDPVDSTVTARWVNPPGRATTLIQLQFSESLSGPWQTTSALAVYSSGSSYDLETPACVRARFLSMNYGEWSEPVCPPVIE